MGCTCAYSPEQSPSLRPSKALSHASAENRQVVDDQAMDVDLQTTSFEEEEELLHQQILLQQQALQQQQQQQQLETEQLLQQQQQQQQQQLPSVWPPAIQDHFLEFNFYLARLIAEYGLCPLMPPPEAPIANQLHPLALNAHAIKAEFEGLCQQASVVSGGFYPQVPVAPIDPRNFGIPIEQYRRLLLQKANAGDPMFLLRSALDECLTDVLKDYAPPDRDASTDKVVQKLQSLTEELQLQFYSSQDEANVTVTICGMIFVVDIEVDFFGTITKARLSYASDTQSQDQQHELADKLLTDTLSKGQFATFKRALASLAFLDGHAGFPQFKCIENDLISIYAIELANSVGKPESVMMHGHGIPLMHIERFGPTVVYWGSPAERLDVAWPSGTEAMDMSRAFAPDAMCKAHIQLELYEPVPVLPSHLNQFLVMGDLPDPVAIQDGLFVQGTSWADASTLTFHVPVVNESTPPANITYFMELVPPVPACGALAKSIGTLVGLCGDAATFVLEAVNYTDGIRYATFAELLVTPEVSAEVLFSTEPRFAASPPPLSFTTSSQPQQRQQETITQPARQTFGFSADASVPGVVISKIPFTHPRQLHSILTHLRRQLTFNYLFRSCFNTRTAGEAVSEHYGASAPAEAGSTFRVMLEAWTPPHRLEFAITRAATAAATGSAATAEVVNTSVRRVAVIVDAQADVSVEVVDPDVQTRMRESRVGRLAQVSLDLVLVFDELTRVLWAEEKEERGPASPSPAQSLLLPTLVNGHSMDSEAIIGTEMPTVVNGISTDSPAVSETEM
ncbi:hypothetical protein HDU86_004358 [Geranomyces michiganensis]|nr:hypothetical protein HDU86_004358 [Geranomyces michiganensis]